MIVNGDKKFPSLSKKFLIKNSNTIRGMKFLAQLSQKNEQYHFCQCQIITIST